MGALSKIIYTFNNLGLESTAGLAIHRVESFMFDLKYGTDTASNIELEDLEFSSENKETGTGYEPTGVRHFKKLLEAIDFPKMSVFVDFGSGKGRALLLASKHAFRKVVGVEFSPELCEIARRNISIYKEKTGVDVDIEVYEGDATKYKIKDKENVFFFYSPFDDQVMHHVLGNIKKSLEKKPRKIWLIDHEHWTRSGRYREVIEEQHEVFAKLETYKFDGHETDVYVNNEDFL